MSEYVCGVPSLSFFSLFLSQLILHLSLCASRHSFCLSVFLSLYLSSLCLFSIFYYISFFLSPCLYYLYSSLLSLSLSLYFRQHALLRDAWRAAARFAAARGVLWSVGC